MTRAYEIGFEAGELGLSEEDFTDEFLEEYPDPDGEQPGMWTEALRGYDEGLATGGWA